MSGVQPPRSRARKHRPETIQLIRSAIINLGALVITVLLLRDAIMFAQPNTSQHGLRLIARSTHFLIWPLELASPLRRLIHGGLSLADILTVLVLALCWVIALGIVAGWEHESRRASSGSPHTSFRP